MLNTGAPPLPMPEMSAAESHERAAMEQVLVVKLVAKLVVKPVGKPVGKPAMEQVLVPEALSLRPHMLGQEA
jgi:hypothetical protein